MVSVENNEEQFNILEDLTNEENEKLKIFRGFPICKGIEDQYLLLFLFSKKFDLEKSHILIKNNLMIREKLNISFPVVKHQVNEELAKKSSSFNIIGHRDKDGRSISYLYPSKLVPKEYSLKDYMTFLLWSQDQSVHDHSSAHREGMTIIEDLHRISMFKHFDSRMTEFLKKYQLNDMQNVFIGRIQKIYIINSPWVLKPLLTLAKTFMKSKIISRVEICKRDHIFSKIDPSNVLIEFGGSLNLTYEAYFDRLPSNF
ncbi:hypothetical protein RB653_008906 [Dictyostelium firmibasis]|uniref:CRAL-TRIO domain-containing protein n=1 Tax=Dictyostelium firmibasis TaxID=79012 RepID=A0AAN7YS79_9MYCE